MNGPFHPLSSELQWEETNGVRGCGGCACFRLTRRAGDESVLLHEIDNSISPQIYDAVFTSRIPKFTEPFVTNFLGIIELEGRAFLVEPLPPSVPLLDTWRAVLRINPDQAGNMLRQLIAQLERLLQDLADRGERHGAVCAKNVVLTTEQTYGLLAARLTTTKGEEIWLRRPGLVSQPNPADYLFTSTKHPEPLALVLQDLLAVEADLEALSTQRRSELHRLCEPYMTTLFQPFRQTCGQDNGSHDGITQITRNL